MKDIEQLSISIIGYDSAYAIDNFGIFSAEHP